MEHKWEYMGNLYPLDICDPERFAVLIDALVELSGSISEVKYGNDFHLLAEMMKKNCEVIEIFFDKVFGEEDRVRICGGTRNIINCSNALASFLGYLSDEMAAMNRSGEEIKAQLFERLSAI
ncbi:MAG: DUF6673 family protein [Eubacteriales bacterium]